MTDWLGILVLGVIAGVYLYDQWRSEPDDEYTADAARQAYVDGEISLTEMERRLELALDEEAERIRETAERVNGVGPDTSAAIATSFDTVAELERASKDELTAINGVGESRAEAIREYLD